MHPPVQSVLKCDILRSVSLYRNKCIQGRGATTTVQFITRLSIEISAFRDARQQLQFTMCLSIEICAFSDARQQLQFTPCLSIEISAFRGSNQFATRLFQNIIEFWEAKINWKCPISEAEAPFEDAQFESCFSIDHKCIFRSEATTILKCVSLDHLRTKA